ncbi:hypothetical protein QUF76_06200 [Desulfobacterales bacterium HSG16]|nr:hypothetical protein [Desulfobacterales bacterium HSG16]
MKYLIIIFCLVFLTPYSAYADTVITISADKQFTFADSLFEEMKYLLCIAEFERFIAFFPNDSRVVQAEYQIGMAWFHLRHFNQAIAAFDKVVSLEADTDYREDDYSTRAFFRAGESHLNQANPGQAVTLFSNLIMLSKDQNVQDKANYKIAWIYMENFKWDRAMLHFDRISLANRTKYRLDFISNEFEKAEQIKSEQTKIRPARTIKQKSPALAGFLGIIPGAGYIYCGRYQDAVTSFIVNSAIATAAYAAFDDENYALGGIITMFGTGFYSGNIYGSVTSAHRYNKQQKRKFFDHIRENSRITLSAKETGLVLGFSFDF